jgi:small subunit ribosomal protein S16
MLRIRLSRTGKKKQPSYRVVVANIESKRDGRIVERLGHYNPLVDPIEYRIEEDRALYWLSVGAQPTDAVRRLLETQGTMDRLARLRQGEPMDSLVAEYTGIPVESSQLSEETDAVAVEEMAAAVVIAAIAEEE